MSAVRWFKSSVLLLSCALALGACSRTPPPAPSPANDPRAATDLAAYRELVTKESFEIAVTMGREIRRKYPGSAAAAEVARSLPDVQAKAKAATERKRLAALWSYQSGEQSGGRQHAASIYSSVPGTEADRLRLILRRHSDWGQSAYVFGYPPGFTCESPCRVSAKFDQDAPVSFEASIPSTGEPAIFIEEDRKFIAAMAGKTRVQIALAPKGKPRINAVFEIGGFDPSKWPQL